MKKIIILLISLTLIFTINNTKNFKANDIDVNASSAILMENNSKRILYEKNIHSRMLTASICKIMTAIICIENLDINKYVYITKETTKQIGSSIYLNDGDYIKVEDLLYGLILRSGNDAAYLLAITVSKTIEKFSYLMNEYAKKIGMYNSTFTNPSGLDYETSNFSTAYDMALLMSYCLSNETFCKINNTKNYLAKTKNNQTIYFSNKHKLINSYDYIIAGKTGYTDKAKRTLISCAKKEEMILIAVTFNCGNDWQEHIKMFDFGYKYYTNKIIIKNQIIKLNNFKYKYIPYVPVDIKYPIRNDETFKIKIKLLNNPVSNSIIIGSIQLYITNDLVKEYDIYRYY